MEQELVCAFMESFQVNSLIDSDSAHSTALTKALSEFTGRDQEPAYHRDSFCRHSPFSLALWICSFPSPPYNLSILSAVLSPTSFLFTFWLFSPARLHLGSKSTNSVTWPHSTPFVALSGPSSVVVLKTWAGFILGFQP